MEPRRDALVVTQPQQRRSRATMERIVTVAEELLSEKPFEQITIAEISTRAGCAPTAIYSKFSDKTALLLEVHDRFKDRVAEQTRLAAEELHAGGASPDELLEWAASGLVTLYRANRRLLRSVLLAGNVVMYERASELTRTLSTTLAERLAADVPARRRAPLERDLDFALRTVVALLQQDLLYEQVAPSRFIYPDGDLDARLAAVLTEAYRRSLS